MPYSKLEEGRRRPRRRMRVVRTIEGSLHYVEGHLQMQEGCLRNEDDSIWNESKAWSKGIGRGRDEMGDLGLDEE